jgi:cysteine synthase B
MKASKPADTVLGLIGDTPMVRINRMNPKPGKVTLYAKLEGFNPTGSIKDRIAYRMVRQAEKEGKLTPGKTIIEPTSGNTGIGLAMIGVALGYPVEIVMSAAVSTERRQMIQAFGAKVTLTDPQLGTDGAIIKARELVKRHPDRYFFPDQFSNEYNKLAHYRTTAEEIWQQTRGKVTHFVSSLGTSGTIMGVGKYLKERCPGCQVVCAEPHKGHYIQGLKNMEEAIVPAIYDKSKLDETIIVDSEDAFELSRRIAHQEGLLVGMSSGAAMYAALEVAKRIDRGVIVVIFPDRGEKYLSTDLFKTKP